MAKGAVGFVVAAGLLLTLISVTGSLPLVVAKTWFLGTSLADHALWMVIGIGAPFTEESVFRWTLQATLVRKLGRLGGIIVVAVLFSLYHLPREPIPFGGRFLLGSAFGVLRERTGWLAAPAFAHFLDWVIVGTR